ncbi:hypothetical protein CLV98_1334 [Dyadobacter jejuensis]|uniref:Uncharacterized protein n=1 Tax=Dyadobacter jejuensis TaxID=1082580 RepID=A0A316A6Y6_9BACT|nr:hypothetical protein [Dyadobacter jejuensis]PWJ52740.1 hypothetical protein CLV98_1334 [Dyadobacter jejuensis]
MDDRTQIMPFSPPEKGVHKMDKFKDHLVNKGRLSVRDQQYFEKMQKAWSWASKMFSPAQVVTMLHNEYGHEKTHAYQILRDAYELWGDAYELDKRGITKTLIEAAHIALSIGIREKNSETILKAAAQLSKLHKLDQIDNIIPPDVSMPTGTRVYVVNGDIHTGGTENIGSGSAGNGREVIDVESEQIP